MSAKAYSRLKDSALSPYRQVVEAELGPDLSLVGSILRQAIEDALGISRFKGGNHNPAASKAYLRSDRWEPLVSATGADPAVIRAALCKRFDWMIRETDGEQATQHRE